MVYIDQSNAALALGRREASRVAINTERYHDSTSYGAGAGGLCYKSSAGGVSGGSTRIVTFPGFAATPGRPKSARNSIKQLMGWPYRVRIVVFTSLQELESPNPILSQWGRSTM